MLQHILSPLFSPPPPHSPRPSIFLLDFSGLLSFGGPVLMDFWPGPCRELPSWEPGAGLNSIPAWVLFLHNQSRPPPYRAQARRRPHPRAGRGILKGPGRPSARGRGCAAAAAGPDTTRGWRFLRGWLGHLGPQPSPHPVAFGSDPSKQTADGPWAPCPPLPKTRLFFPVHQPLPLPQSC